LSFSQTTKWICTKFFSEFKRRHSFITTCIEKLCTWSFNEKVYELAHKFEGVLNDQDH